MSDFLSFQNLNGIGKLAIAHAFILFLFLLGMISYALPFSDAVRPYFMLIILYFWSIYRPSLLSPAYVFCLGILFDFILNYPTGLHAVLFVLVQWGVRDQRLFFIGQPYVIAWIAFTVTCFFTMSLEWLFFAIIANNFSNFDWVVYGTLITTLVFPLVTLLFNVIYRSLPAVPQSHLL